MVLGFFFFLMWSIFKVFLEFVTIFCFMFWFFGHEACGTLAGTCSPYIERRTLNHWTTREVPAIVTFKSICFLLTIFLNLGIVFKLVLYSISNGYMGNYLLFYVLYS